jgi:hypothetical protein
MRNSKVAEKKPSVEAQKMLDAFQRAVKKVLQSKEETKRKSAYVSLIGTCRSVDFAWF